MADPAQQAGGDEQVPAAVVTTTPATAKEESVIPTENPPAPEPAKIEELMVEAKVDKVETEVNKTEAKVDIAKAKVDEIDAKVNIAETDKVDNIEVLPTPIINPEPEVPPQESKDIKPEVPISEPKQNNEVQQTKEDEIRTDPVDVPLTVESTDKDAKSNDTPKELEDWQKRESELLKKIEELEKVKNARSEDGLRLELKVREEEIDLLKARVKNLEMELQAALSKPGGKNHEMIETIKQQHEELLSKARGMIFDKTKMVKNQELQIEALTTQVQSLKDINLITKDLLEIRNSEVKAMEERFQAMEARFKAEKERYDLVLKRAQTSTNINDDLRKEYETQLAIFKELREKYEQRVQALVAENNRLKEAAKGPGTSG